MIAIEVNNAFDKIGSLKKRRILMLIRESFPVGPLQCNCTIVACDVTKEAVVIDPGGDAEVILERGRSLGVRIVNIVHTHAHFDHIGATRAVHDATKAIRYLHEADLFLYNNVAKQTAAFGISSEAPGGLEKYLTDDLEISIGKGRFQTIHTPGHTPGSCCFHFEEIKFLSSGDTLFRDGVGRTDLWQGDFKQLEKSIRERLYTIDPATVVVAGHGASTTIGREMKTNQFVRPLRK